MLAAAQPLLLLALAALAGAPVDERPAHVTSAALDLTALDEDAYRRLGGLALEKQAVLRLVQESFAVVAPAAAPDVLLKVEVAEGGALRLTASSRAASEEREVAVGADEALEELHLEVSQKLVELARAVTPPPAPEPPPKPVEPVEPQEPPQPPPRGWRIDAVAGAEALFRRGGNDVQARLALRWGERLGVSLSGALSPSHTSDIKVLEWTILVGPSWRQALATWLDLDVGLSVGALLHHYKILNAYSHDHAGTREDLETALPVSLTFRPIPELTLGLRVAGRYDGRGREHLLGTRVLWRREAWGLEAGAGLGARF